MPTAMGTMPGCGMGMGISPGCPMAIATARMACAGGGGGGGEYLHGSMRRLLGRLPGHAGFIVREEESTAYLQYGSSLAGLVR